MNGGFVAVLFHGHQGGEPNIRIHHGVNLAWDPLKMV
jgi:hypothetical protein